MGIMLHHLCPGICLIGGMFEIPSIPRRLFSNVSFRFRLHDFSGNNKDFLFTSCIPFCVVGHLFVRFPEVSRSQTFIWTHTGGLETLAAFFGQGPPKSPYDRQVKQPSCSNNQNLISATYVKTTAYFIDQMALCCLPEICTVQPMRWRLRTFWSVSGKFALSVGVTSEAETRKPVIDKYIWN